MSPSSNNSIIIFDWDDTICPSSFVDRAGVDNYKKLPKKCHSLFTEIEKCAEKCLAEAAKYGEVIIITNSDDGWVKYSAERYLPGLLPILKNYRIVSARTRYEKFYPNQPLCWKAAAFAHEANEHFCGVEESALLDSCSKLSPDLPDMDLVSTDESSMGEGSISSHEESPGYRQDSCLPSVYRREIVSFGDSMEERTAVKIVSDQLSSTPKSVMFLSNPTPTQIIGQLTMLTHHMGFVCRNETDLDLEISQKQAEKCAAGYLSKMAEPAVVKEPNILQRLLRAGSACMQEDDEMEQYGC
ncbi:hypothetical protein ACHAWO_004333 [Cyclotella atomus]|uniref:Uncharacterized protein n=1 Tax=Cyclotella atomus TaxID=382360 RepID=A0ABD3MM92_9STRA